MLINICELNLPVSYVILNKTDNGISTWNFKVSSAVISFSAWGSLIASLTSCLRIFIKNWH